MLTDPRCNLSLLVWVFVDTNGLKVKYCQVLEQFLLFFIWDIECIQLLKKRFSQSQSVNILWVNMINTITTSKQISFQLPRLWEKCVTRSTLESFEQGVYVVDYCDCCSVNAWYFFLTFENLSDGAHQSVLQLQNQYWKGRYWVATSLQFSECHSNEHLGKLKRLLLQCFWRK